MAQLRDWDIMIKFLQSDFALYFATCIAFFVFLAIALRGGDWIALVLPEKAVLPVRIIYGIMALACAVYLFLRVSGIVSV